MDPSHSSPLGASHSDVSRPDEGYRGTHCPDEYIVPPMPSTGLCAYEAIRVPNMPLFGRSEMGGSGSAGSGEERRGLGQPGCEEAAARVVSGAGGSCTRSGETHRRGGRTGGVTSHGSPHWNLIFIYPGFTLLLFPETFLKTVFFPVLIYFGFPFPAKSGRPFGEIAPVLPQITSDFGNQQREERGSKSSKEKSRKRDWVRERARASEKREDRGKVSDLLLGVTARARREPSPSGSRVGPAALTDRQTDTAPRPSAHLLPGRRPTVDAAASRGQEPEPAPGGGVEGVGARGVALKLFIQLLGCSRSGGAVVRLGAADPSETGRSASSVREEPQSAEGEEEEEKEEERGPRWRLGSRKPGSWTGEAAVCADSAPAARAPQALARALAPGGRGARLGAEESGRPRSPSQRGSASRASPGRASETMNFLLSWVHWSLALLLYLHHAKWSQAAPMTAGEQKPHEVVKFMDVYQRSYCRPIETLVDIFQEYPDEIEYIFKPSCVPLMRCGGCCNDEGLECVPTEEFNITMQIMRIKPHQGQHIGEMSFLQHNKCECRPKKDRARQEKKSVRGKGKGQKRKRKKSRYKSWSVPCGPCSERRKHLFVQDPQTCKCSCKNTDSRCKARQLELNERTCRCDKPRR
ncbi:vascular endothelial growth factor A [Camelus ferus]|uniref:Vascular endothelial growth factor A n=6 Tax=Boreoeutheria TaxID=1437010 RepID=A0A8B8RN96_CAMFR|nr:vascular endothelial growth factor A [Camelus ferus]